MPACRTLTILFCLGLLRGGAVAHAAPPPQAEPPPTRLELSADASSELQRTVLTATLVAAAEGQDPAAVQGSVNDAMTRALAAARQRSAIKATNGTYAIRPEEQAPDRSADAATRRYRAEQSLVLSADDAAAVLDLVGRLQAMGLEVRGLDYVLPPAAVESARRRLLDDALHELRALADRAATAMGMRLGAWEEIRVEPDSSTSSPPTFRAMLVERAPAVPPPVAAAGSERVTLTVSGTALLVSAR